MKKAFIYKIENVENGKRYIGSSVTPQKRWYQHKQQLRKGVHHSIYLQNSWNKYGEECFIFEIIDECNLENQFSLEKEWIIKENTTDSEYGYNMLTPTDTGGHTKTDEYKKMIGEISKKNMLLYHEKQRKAGKYAIRVYDLITGEYEIFDSTKDCPYNFHKNTFYNFRIAKCKLDNNLTEEELTMQYIAYKNRYEAYLKLQERKASQVKKRTDPDWRHCKVYYTKWTSEHDTLYFKCNDEAVTYFKSNRPSICTAVKSGKYTVTKFQLIKDDKVISESHNLTSLAAKNNHNHKAYSKVMDGRRNSYLGFNLRRQDIIYKIEKHITPQPSSPLSL